MRRSAKPLPDYSVSHGACPSKQTDWRLYIDLALALCVVVAIVIFL